MNENIFVSIQNTFKKIKEQRLAAKAAKKDKPIDVKFEVIKEPGKYGKKFLKEFEAAIANQ